MKKVFGPKFAKYGLTLMTALSISPMLTAGITHADTITDSHKAVESSKQAPDALRKSVHFKLRDDDGKDHQKDSDRFLKKGKVAPKLDAKDNHFKHDGKNYQLDNDKDNQSKQSFRKDDVNKKNPQPIKLGYEMNKSIDHKDSLNTGKDIKHVQFKDDAKLSRFSYDNDSGKKVRDNFNRNKVNSKNGDIVLKGTDNNKNGNDDQFRNVKSTKNRSDADRKDFNDGIDKSSKLVSGSQWNNNKLKVASNESQNHESGFAKNDRQSDNVNVSQKKAFAGSSQQDNQKNDNLRAKAGDASRGTQSNATTPAVAKNDQVGRVTTGKTESAAPKSATDQVKATDGTHSNVSNGAKVATTATSAQSVKATHATTTDASNK